jgi:2-amino-4-hydroxy-6-hydroxymethyldihydropteridine diphosphokinase
MVALRTTLAPLALLDHLLSIELSRGRERSERWAPRTLDLDIVIYDDREITEPRLRVPHPELPNRDFWRRELLQAEQRLAAVRTNLSSP